MPLEFGQLGKFDFEAQSQLFERFLYGTMTFEQFAIFGEGQKPKPEYSLDSQMLSIVLNNYEAFSRFFTKESLDNAVNFSRYVGENGTSSSQIEQWVKNNGELKLELKNGKAFFELAGFLLFGAGEKDKVGFVALWAGKMQKRYDESLRGKTVYSALDSEQMVEAYLRGEKEKVGKCPQINGRFVKELAHSLGLEAVAIAYDNRNSGVGHTVALIKGDSYYLVNYGEYEELGKSIDYVSSQIYRCIGGVYPGLFDKDVGSHFYMPAEEKALYEIINFAGRECGEKLGAQFFSDGRGNAGARLQAGVQNFTFGAFFMQTEPGIPELFGGHINYRSDEREGIILAPSMDLSLVFGTSTDFTIMGAIEPILFEWEPMHGFELRFSPMSVRGHHSGKRRGDGVVGSMAGLLYRKDDFGEVRVDVESAYITPANSPFDYLSADVAWKMGAKYKSPQFGEDLKVGFEAGADYMPKNVLRQGEAELGANIKYGNATIFIGASAQVEGEQVGFGGFVKIRGNISDFFK